MPKVGKNEINTQQFRRNFIQFGGPGPDNTPKYAGLDTDYMTITGLTVPQKGDVDIQYVPDPFTPGRLRRVASTRGEPDPIEATLSLLEKRGKIPWIHFQQNCAFNFYELVGNECSDLSNTESGWDSYVRIYSYVDINSADFGAVQDWESDEQNATEAALTVGSVQTVGALSFGTKAASTVTAEITDVVFGKQVRCGDCGLANDGTRFIYAVQKGTSSPAAKPLVIYSTDYGGSWSSVSVATAANAESIIAMDVVGDKLVLLSNNGGTAGASCLYVSQINNVTGVPSTTFTKVTPSVFTSGNTSFDMFVSSPGEVFFCGTAGYVFKSTDVLSNMTVVSAGDATSEALTRIHGVDDAIYAVGANAAVIKSANRGATWSVTTTLPGAAQHTAVAVIDALRAWVGNNAGAVYTTEDGGETWTLRNVAADAAGIKDIVFATDEVGMIAYNTSAPAGRVASTIFGGAKWSDSSASTKRLGTLPSISTLNRIAFPTSGDPTVNVNTVILGGIGVSPDGSLIMGVAARS